MVAIGVEELCLVLLDDVLHLLVHIVDCSVQLAVGLVYGLRTVRDELGLYLHSNKINSQDLIIKLE